MSKSATTTTSRYQSTPQHHHGLTANQMAYLAEYDELNMFRDSIFQCTDNVWPSCLLSFCCPFTHIGYLAHRLQALPLWVPPALLFGLLYILVNFDSPLTEAIYFSAWTAVIFYARLQVRKYFRPNPGLLGDFNQLPGHLDDCCLSLWCGCCAIAQLSRHIGNYKLHSSSSTTGGDDGHAPILVGEEVDEDLL